MKTSLVNVAAALLTSSAASVYAASAGMGGEGAGLLIWVLIGFAVVVVMLQAIPAVVMLYAMIKGLLAPADATAALPKA